MDSLGSALDQVSGLVGRAFVISAFIPVLLFAAANVAALAVLDGTNGLEKRWSDLKELQTPAAIGFVLVIFASGYLLMMASPVLKRLIEGEYPLGPPGRLFLAQKRRLFIKKRDGVRDTLDNFKTIGKKRREWEEALQTSASASTKRGVRRPPDDDEIKKVERLVGELYRDVLEETALGRLDQAVALVKELYDLNIPPERLERSHRELVQMIADLEKSAEANYAEALSDLQSRFAYSSGIGGVRSTAVGNIMAASWSYPFTRYGIDATLMWPKLQKVIPTAYFRVVEDARISYDFTVGMILLSALFCLTWLVALLSQAMWSWLWLPAIGLVASILFLLAVIEAARGQAAVLRTCFDLFRFQLLKELRIELPVDLAAERNTWSAINQLLLYEDSESNLKYVHP
jgi:hypothetical protein